MQKRKAVSQKPEDSDDERGHEEKIRRFLDMNALRQRRSRAREVSSVPRAQQDERTERPRTPTRLAPIIKPKATTPKSNQTLKGSYPGLTTPTSVGSGLQSRPIDLFHTGSMLSIPARRSTRGKEKVSSYDMGGRYYEKREIKAESNEEGKMSGNITEKGTVPEVDMVRRIEKLAEAAVKKMTNTTNDELDDIIKNMVAKTVERYLEQRV
ncbi:hypothetical protein BDZ45DRAFT_687295 [Acephala macrosclerotiorum]|nr:hypothetical protein BDZ45DRAFT_687295 [Acephala macrosclerotiorum]